MSTTTVEHDGAPRVLTPLSEGEAYLYAILQDESGLDQAEFLWHDQASEDNKFCVVCGSSITSAHLYEHPLAEEEADRWYEKYQSPSGCFRAWPYQWSWWRSLDTLQIDQCARSVGKSLSIKVRGCAFPFVKPGQEMVITAPELVHLEPIVGLIESQVYSTRLLREMIPRTRSAVTHRPFQLNFSNGSRIIGRIPQRDGKGVKGCVVEGTPVLTEKGFKPAEQVEVGDKVLTHKGRFRPVTAVYEDVNDAFEVQGQSSFPMQVSCDHRFYGAENHATSKQKRKFSELSWHDVELLTDHQVYWATPRSFPTLPIPFVLLPIYQPGLWWLIGRWLADGYLSMDRKNDKSRKVHWVVHPDQQDKVLEILTVLDRKARVVERDHSSANVIEVGHAGLHDFLLEHFGEHSSGKRLPAFALGMQPVLRSQLLEGYLSGDGHWSEDKNRWEVGTASKMLATGIQLLAQSLGFTVNCTTVTPKVTSINGVELVKPPQQSWRIQIGKGHPEPIDDYLVAKVKKVVPIGERTVYDIRVDEDHSLLTGTVMSHNIHPIWLELDEAQDYPEPGWTELTETLKRGMEGARWRAHGVTRGVRDKFYEYTSDDPDNMWKVHRYPAMYRPNWTQEEREQKIAEYGGVNDPDYRRNVLGLHGDNTSAIFVLAQLMSRVDDNPDSDYNQLEYFHPGWGRAKKNPAIISMENLRLYDMDITEQLDYPRAHLLYRGDDARNPQAYFWVGMDVGFTTDPSELLVFVEYWPEKQKPSKIRLISRASLVRMKHHEQIKAILHTIDFYRPRAFGIDKGGHGLPMYQEIQEHLDAFARKDWEKVPPWMREYNLDLAIHTIKGYNFAEKLIVDFDKAIPLDDFDDPVQKAGMKRNAKEYSTDVLRDLVDANRLELPWDPHLITQFSGAHVQMAKGSTDQYGRRIFSKGNDHTLDASRFMALAWKQYSIEAFLNQPQDWEPVLDRAVF